MKRGEIIRVQIDRLNPDGTGYAVAEGRKLSIKGILPGDEADVRVLSVKRHTARVKLETIISTGVERISPECPHFSYCGGCRWQDVPYNVQCRMKGDLVNTALAGVPGIEPVERIDVVPSPDVFFYRNKMEFSFDSPPPLQGKVFLGLHEAGKFDRVFDLEDCRLQSELSNRAVQVTRAFVMEQELSAYGLKSHEGLLRFLVVRDGKNTGDLMLNLVTSGEDFTAIKAFSERVVKDIPGVTTVIRSINRGKGSVAIGEEHDIFFGDGFIREHIGEYIFTISPDSFFQTNPRQTENLYNTIRDFSGLSGRENLLDLYCGTGTIGIYLAGMAKTVTGVETVESCIADAERNAELNDVSNITFLSGQVEKVIGETMGTFDVVVCDPPRAGLHPKALNKLLRLRIPRMVYVSCNIKAMPHDLEMLAMAGYRVKDVRAFDMSPHTPYVETVILLEIG
ncbi:23S rRNA (uracil(1939)-C(5))-methyltransferase RlmD [Candidatus Latescibacterota bacterium]